MATEGEAYSIFFIAVKNLSALQNRQFLSSTRSWHLRLFTTRLIAWYLWRWFSLVRNFTLEHIAGVKNIIADALSRLCANYIWKICPKSLPWGHICPCSFQDFKIPMISRNLLWRSIHFAGITGDRTIKKLLVSYPVLAALNNIKKVRVLSMPEDFRHCTNTCCFRLLTSSRYTPMECLNIDYVGPFQMAGILVSNNWLFHTLDRILRRRPATARPFWCLLQHFLRSSHLTVFLSLLTCIWSS
jgi:hypothetical protein